MIADYALRDSTVAEPALRNLKSRLSGELILPGDSGYDAARGVWNGAYDCYPDVIVRPADAIDVIRAVNLAREYDLAVAVRSGGHSMAGFGTSDGGMVIDLSAMKGLSIDPERRVARVQPGVTWAEYAEKANEYGLATSSGDMGSVGVGGLVLGGGIGWMVRKHGLTIDHLLSVDIVTADGRLLTASDTENPDLFWAVRGGGGNFGIATSFELELEPAGIVLGGALFFEGSDIKGLLQEYARVAAAAPDELSTQAMVMLAPPAPFIPEEKRGTLSVAILLVYNGDLEEGQRAVAPLRALGTPIADLVGPMPYPVMFELSEEGGHKGLHHDVRSMYAYTLDEHVAEAVETLSKQMTSPLSMTQIRILGGAMARVPESATAFAHRDKSVLVILVSSRFDGQQPESHQDWLEQYWSAVRPYGAGVYANFLQNEGEARVREAYKPRTYERLVAVKNRYDPTNFFSRNQNIKPSV